MTKMEQNYQNLRGKYHQNGTTREFRSKILGLIDSRRIDLKMTKGKLAAKINMSRKQFERIENGKLTLVELEAIFRALELSVIIVPDESLTTI